jgi:hypothetical protein
VGLGIELAVATKFRTLALKESWLIPFRGGMQLIRIWVFWACACGIWLTVSTFVGHTVFAEQGGGHPRAVRPLVCAG